MVSLFMVDEKNKHVNEFRASGIAYAALRQAKIAVEETTDIDIAAYDHTDYHSRVEAAKSICEQYSRIGIGANADPECRTLVIAFFAPVRKMGDDHESGLAAAVDRIRLDAPHDPGVSVDALRTLAATADIHVLKRLASRADKVSLRQFSNALTPAWGWSSVADLVGVDGAYMISVREGLICSERLKSSVLCPEGKPIWKTTVKTFISHDEMNEKNATAWRYLREAGCISGAPRFPSFDTDVSESQKTMMYQMRAEGRAWESRRDYALRAIAAQEGDTYDPDESLSLF